MRQRVGRLAPPLLCALSLLPTPILLFVSSSVPLYTKNQSLLQYQQGVLLPFLKLSSLTFLLGVLLHIGSRYRWVRCGLWIYYLAGPAFMLFSFGRAFAGKLPLLSWLYETGEGLALWPSLLLAASLILGLHEARRLPVKSFALFGAALLVSETYPFNFPLPSGGPPLDYGKGILQASVEARRLPNIYHIVMDGYQVELFEKTLTAGAEEDLAGFVYYPKNTSFYHTSMMSLASVFSGKPFLYDRTRNDYIDKAFNSRESMLYWMKQRGYTTLAYVPGDWSAWMQFRLFDRMVFLENRAAVDLLDMNTKAFRNLWFFSNTTGPLRDWLLRSRWFSELDEEDLQLLRARRLLPPSTPIVSYLGLKKVIEDEARQPASNRYTLIHLLIPHAPYKLRADCSYKPAGQKTSALEQYRCALVLLEDFVQRLKRLGRFDESIIVIHGDHGGHFRLRHGVLRPASSRSLRAVLLIKPPGRTAREPFIRSNEEITLLELGAKLRAHVEQLQGGGKEPHALPGATPRESESSS